MVDWQPLGIGKRIGKMIHLTMIHQIMRLLAIRSIENNDRLGLIRFLVWVDGNGIWTDSDSIANDMEPITFQEAKEKVQEFLASMVN